MAFEAFEVWCSEGLGEVCNLIEDVDQAGAALDVVVSDAVVLDAVALDAVASGFGA